ncbi:MAG TPA: family 1 encapsulin nanocompartment shell protein [Blastocatellia bacterium]|nr:family 1 encapsulin nanocompartment shell protein [Blastocatellia bacterium]
MSPFTHTSDPLTFNEWEALNHIIKIVGNSTVSRRIIEATVPLGAGIQTVPNESLVGITEGYKSILGSNGLAIKPGIRDSGIVPIIFKDFIIHWRDLEESRITGQEFSKAKAAAAASSCARAEDKLALFGHDPLGYSGLMTAEGRNVVDGLEWKRPGDAFKNFTKMTGLLADKGHTGPYAAVVHPRIYTDMHRVLAGSALLEVIHVRALLTSGVFRSELLLPNTGLVIATGRQHFELVISVDTSAAFLGARRMNLPFRIFKAIYLRIRRSDAICTFAPK